MATKLQIQQLMNEIGPLLELTAVGEFDDGNAWTLVVDEETEVSVEFDDAEGRLMLSSEIGIPNNASHTFYETLLVYNSQWQRTGGVRMGLNEPGGAVVQVFDISTTGLDLEKLARVTAGFVDIARGWRQVVMQGKPSAIEDEVSTSAHDIPPSGIRV
jgi:hypothetical protein